MRDSKQLHQYFNSIGIIAFYYLQIYKNFHVIQMDYMKVMIFCKIALWLDSTKKIYC